ncbi:MAG TPA: NUDIX hydrolase [Candidatus Saccharimonadales bacterium]|nr:NUDIX hydrolase [Candidatus Saccharimonadales bacterium]
MITCTFENGNGASLRHITVGAIALNEKSQILLVKRASQLSRGNKYTIPGGFLDRDETIQQAVLREFQEETGYQGNIKMLFRINDNPQRPNEDRQNVDVLYIVDIISGEKTLNEEVAEIAWFDKKDIPTKEEFAFDHRESILRYFDYLENSFVLPIIG